MKLIAKNNIFHKNSGRSYARFEVFETDRPNDFSELHFVKVADDYALPDCEAKYLKSGPDGLPAEMSPEDKQMIDEAEAVRAAESAQAALKAKHHNRRNFTADLVAEVWANNEVNQTPGSFAAGQLQKLSPVRELLDAGMFETGLQLLESLEVDQYLSAESKAYFVGKIETFLQNE